MPQFRFVAKKNPKETVEDVIEADNRDDVLRHIADLGYTPVRIEMKQSAREGGGETVTQVATDRVIPSRMMENFMRQFASLTRSQIPILTAMRILDEQTTHQGLKLILAEMRRSIQVDGRSLSESMRMFPKAFPADIVSLIFAGETGGALQEILDQLASRLEREESLKSKLQGALVYPLFVGAVGLITVAVLVVFVLPKILKTLKGLGGHLPLPTQILLAITHATGQLSFWIIFGVVVAVGAVVLPPLITSQRLAVDRFLFRLPAVGTLIAHIELVRFCRSFGMLLDHGVLILQALDASIPVVGNHFLRQDLGQIPAAVREGRPLTEGLRPLVLTTPYLLQSLIVGESGGRVAEVLKEVADYYEKEAEKQMQVVATLLEPCMILSVGLMVGFIVMAVLLPIFEISVSVR